MLLALTASNGFDPTVPELPTVTLAALVPSQPFFNPVRVATWNRSILSPAWTVAGTTSCLELVLLNDALAPARNAPDTPGGGGVGLRSGLNIGRTANALYASRDAVDVS